MKRAGVRPGAVESPKAGRVCRVRPVNPAHQTPNTDISWFVLSAIGFASGEPSQPLHLEQISVFEHLIRVRRNLATPVPMPQSEPTAPQAKLRLEHHHTIASFMSLI
eukprot:scaffold75517_cov32-Tisochrysis_lutea.AAC.2